MKSLHERLAISRAEDIYEERAGILEFEAGFSRAESEVMARSEVNAWHQKQEAA